MGKVGHTRQECRNNRRKRSQAHDDGVEQAAENRRVIAAKRSPVFSQQPGDPRQGTLGRALLALKFLRRHFVGLYRPFAWCSNGKDNHLVLPDDEKSPEFSLRANAEQKMS